MVAQNKIVRTTVIPIPVKFPWPIWGLLAVLAYMVLVVLGNRFAPGPNLEASGTAQWTTVVGPDEVLVTSWNIGYGGLGAESDFVADGGKHFRPPNRKIVDKNIAGITTYLESYLGEPKAEVFLIQEAAKSSFLTRGGDSLKAIDEILSARDNRFSADFSLKLLPPPFNNRHGLFSSSSIEGGIWQVVSLPLAPEYYAGLSQRKYHLQVLRLEKEGVPWTIVNLHLSAFDEGANIRLLQLRAALDFAKSEFAEGRHVVLGGDWNYEFARPGRPSTTLKEFKFWLHPFPYEELEEGWRAIVDKTTPTVRTNERPYEAGENYTTIIDGFVISPNVQTQFIATDDLDFQFSDHQPVTAMFKVKSP